MATATGFQVEVLKEPMARNWEHLVGPDHCPRCGGLLVTDQCLDLQDDSGQLDFWGRRCVQCGEVIDPVILQNRRRQLPVGRGANHRGAGFARSKEGI